MPKCELKPWMLDRPQVILVNRYDGSKLFACFCKNEAGEIYRKVWEQQKRRNGDKLIYPLDEISLADWIDDFLDLLGIPETIEEVKDENL